MPPLKTLCRSNKGSDIFTIILEECKSYIVNDIFFLMRREIMYTYVIVLLNAVISMYTFKMYAKPCTF